MKYKLVADSSSNVLHMEEVDYTNVALKIITDEKEYEDDEKLDVDAMVEELRSYRGRSGTSCPNVNDWLQAFGDADAVIGVAITGNLSGSYASALQAAEEYKQQKPEAEVFVLDSLSAGPELQLFLEALRDMIHRELPFAQIKSNLEEYAKKTHLLFSLESLKNLVRNGRVSPAVAAIAGMLGLRMVGKASDEGTLALLHKCRGEKKAITALWKEMEAGGFAGGKVRIAHCQNPDMAEAFARTVRKRWPDSDITILPCRGLCSFYAEKGGLMIGFEG